MAGAGIVAVWANVHGSFFLGPLVVGLAWLEDVHDHSPAASRTLGIALVSAAAACLTPFGPLVWAYAAGLSTNPAVTARVTEWQPTSLRDVPGLLFYASVFAVVVLMARSGRRISWPMLAWLGVFFVIGAYAQRGVAWWPLAAVTAVAGSLVPSMAGVPRHETLTIRRANALLAGVVVLACVIVLPVNREVVPGAGVPADLVAPAPAGVTATIRDLAAPGDKVFNPQTWGSWFEYALPHVLVAVDSRVEMFRPQVWDTYERIIAGGDGWQRALSMWGVTHVVVEAEDEQFRDRLTEAGWRIVYSDADGVVLIRS